MTQQRLRDWQLQGLPQRIGGVTLILVSAILLPNKSLAQDTKAATAVQGVSDVRAELREVEKRIKAEQQRVARLESERSSIESRLKELESAQEDTVSERDTVQDSVIRLSTEAERLKLTLFGARQQMEHQRARMHRRFVALYKTQRRTPSTEYLFRADSTTDLLKRAKYLSRVTEHDQQYISQLTEVVRRGQDDRKRLEELLEERRTKLVQLTDLGEQLEQQRFQTATLLREKEAKAEQQQASLLALKLSATQLQKMLGELMDSAEPQPGTERPADAGVGLARVRGTLSFPVSGRLLQSFGKQRHTEFEDILFKKGLEVAAAPGEYVAAVAEGTVLFRQELPGYGLVVIVDHGARYYSLYGRLAEIFVEVGQKVSAGEQLAITGPLDSLGRNFYFELRHRGKATDPSSFFRKLPEPV